VKHCQMGAEVTSDTKKTRVSEPLSAVHLKCLGPILVKLKLERHHIDFAIRGDKVQRCCVQMPIHIWRPQAVDVDIPVAGNGRLAYSVARAFPGENVESELNALPNVPFDILRLKLILF
jgi:hypothetical protein